MDTDTIQKLSDEQLGLEFGLHYADAYRKTLRNRIDDPSAVVDFENESPLQRLRDEIAKRNPKESAEIVDGIIDRIEVRVSEQNSVANGRQHSR